MQTATPSRHDHTYARPTATLDNQPLCRHAILFFITEAMPSCPTPVACIQYFANCTPPAYWPETSAQCFVSAQAQCLVCTGTMSCLHRLRRSALPQAPLGAAFDDSEKSVNGATPHLTDSTPNHSMRPCCDVLFQDLIRRDDHRPRRHRPRTPRQQPCPQTPVATPPHDCPGSVHQ